MKFRLHKIRRLARIPLPVVILLFLCNFSWASENRSADIKLNNAGFIDPGDQGTVLSNVQSVCQLIQSIIANQVQKADFAEPLTDNPQQTSWLYRLSFSYQNISSISIAINAP
jgi:hypothetical protein